LRVTHDGSPIPYTGIAGPRVAPTRESYMQIQAGGSLSREIDISEKYDLTEAGDYEVSFHLPILGAFETGDGEPPLQDSRYKLTFIESKKIAFRSVAAMCRGRPE
jgi:hypothetical protein